MNENQEQQKIQKLPALWKHGFLIVLLCLLAANIVNLTRNLKSGYSGEKYTNMVVAIALLFNHIAFFYAASGLWSKIMKTIAVAWLIFGGVYIFSRFF
jgi:hypothetical protein